MPLSASSAYTLPIAGRLPRAYAGSITRARAITSSSTERPLHGRSRHGRGITSDITKKLSLQYKISDDAMVYALFSDGFRAGGRNVVRPGTVLPPDYEPDFLDNYELGFKSRWLDDRIAFNLTAFKMEWKDYQVEVVDPGDLYVVLVANVGDAEIEGVSIEFSARLWESLDVGLNAQFLDAETKEANPIIGTGEGDRLPFSAEEKGALWLEYTFPWQLFGRPLLRPVPV